MNIPNLTGNCNSKTQKKGIKERKEYKPKNKWGILQEGRFRNYNHNHPLQDNKEQVLIQE